MVFYLGRFNKDWADEFYAEGLIVLTGKEKKEWDELAAKHADTNVTYYFGSNEGWEDATVSEILESWEFEELSDKDGAILKNHFPEGFGICPTPADLADRIDEED